MARWTGEWLSGMPASQRGESPARWPGERLGLPQRGPGSVAGAGVRISAFVVDLITASLVTSIFRGVDFSDPAAMQTFNLWALGVWAVITALPVAFFGFTPGMALIGVRVARLDGKAFVGPIRAIVRAILTFLLVPAAIRNEDGRSVLDRLTGTVVIRMRGASDDA